MLQSDVIRPIWELLDKHALERPSHVAFKDDARTLTYAELAQRTARIGGHLGSYMSSGEPVALVMANRVELAECYLAVVRASGIATCLNAAASDDELAYMLGDCGTHLVIVDQSTHERVAALVADGVRVIDVDAAGPDGYESFANDAAAPSPRDALDVHAAAFMLYTSGTTGRPKGVLLSQHSCLWVVAACWIPVLELTDKDNILSALPLFHSYALDLTVLAVIATGCGERILPKFSASGVVRLLREEAVTILPGVPTMFHYLVETLGGEPGSLKPLALRLCVSAGAILSADQHAQFMAVAGTPLLDGYGITETSTMVTMNWATGTIPAGSCGLPVLGCAVRLLDPETGLDVSTGVEGELIVKGPQLMIGYHGKPEETANVLRNGWYHSGDLAKMDANGFLTITGRIKELIIRGGENIYPAEVERVLLRHASVEDVAVTGEQDAALGEIVVAYVVPRDSASFDATELLEFAGKELSAFKVPSRVEVTAQIPRTGSGKIRRHHLRPQAVPATQR